MSEDNYLMQRTFVDANVFLDVVLNETSKGFEFFEDYRGKNKMIITSTHAMGEVVRRIYRLAKEESSNSESELKIDNIISAFRKLLDTCNVQIENVDDKTYQVIKDIFEEDNRIKFKDAIHVALAYQNNCHSFCTFDTGINQTTLKRFGMKYSAL